MKKLLSLFLAFVIALGLLPTGAFAADSVEAALGEVNIYNGDYELGYLSINGTVRKQIYTYFLYEAKAPVRASNIWPRKSPAIPRWWASFPTATPTAAWGS